jgi:membrane-bound serine protease (ClpP class)
MRLRNRQVITRDETLLGREGIVVRDLGPRGVVQVASEEWTADAVSGTPRRGERIRVVAMDGVRLKVEPVEDPAITPPPAGAEEVGQTTGGSTT